MPLGFAIEASDLSSFALSSSAHNASATGRELMLGACIEAKETYHRGKRDLP
jgi:hypothetical protein